MKKINISLLIVLFSSYLFAGNEDRAGEAGASELLINPWSRSSGLGSSNSASAIGIEAMNLNVAGLAFTRSTELVLSNTRWLEGTDINIFSVGLAKRLGETGVLGITISSMDFGEIDITTEESPDGGLGTFDPNYLNIGTAYSKRFSNSISGGVVFRIISENTADVNSRGIALDAGVNYVTGNYDAFKFGITLRNVGPPMKFSGNGLTSRGSEDDDPEKVLSIKRRSNEFELPSMVNIGASYDFYLSPVNEEEESSDDADKIYADHRLTASGTFTSNSFTRDQFRGGIEYGFREMFMARFGYVFETDSGNEELTRTTTSGPSFGATVEVPINKNGSTFGIDYSYRVTRTFDGTNSIGVRLTF